MKLDKKILLVEDDLNLGFLLVDFLQSQRFYVKLCRDGLSGLKAVENESFDLCIFDVMMPKMDGYAVAKTMRKKGITTPFIFLTAKAMKEDKLVGYEIGAEDYISKPFDEEELLCKINVILRREKKDPFENYPTQFKFQNFLFDYDRQELTLHGILHRMTEKENELLRLLCINKNKILKRCDAVSHIYGRHDYFLGRSFDVYISRLRKLLHTTEDIDIENVYKVGFILNVPDAQLENA